MEFSNVVSYVENKVAEIMNGNDASHDMKHIHRVVKLALHLAKKEDPHMNQETIQVIHLSALLHDVKDEKYDKDTTITQKQLLELILKEAGWEGPFQQVIDIVENVSFRKMLIPNKNRPQSLAFHCVSDADKLDAIGAIGVARCFTFGGSQGDRPLYDPNEKIISDLSYESYSKQKTSSLGHFYEKLFKLKDFIKTETGKEMAKERHSFMIQFVDQFLREHDMTPTET